MLRTCSVKELWTVAYLLPVLLLMNWCILVCITLAMFLKSSVINGRCFFVNLYVVGYENSLEKHPEGFGKVLEFRVSNIVGSLVLLTGPFLPLPF